MKMIKKLLGNFSIQAQPMPEDMDYLKDEGISPLFANTVHQLANEQITVGLQEDKGKIVYILAEKTVGNEERGIVYAPATGDFYGCVEKDGAIEKYPIVDGRHDMGELILATVIEAICNSSKVPNTAIANSTAVGIIDAYESLIKNIKAGLKPGVSALEDFKMLQNGVELLDENGAIQLSLINNAPLELNRRGVKDGAYAPTTDVNMPLFSGNECGKKINKKNSLGVGYKVSKWLDTFGDKYFAPYEPNKEEKELLKVQLEQTKDFLVTESVMEIVLNYHLGGIKKGYLIGEAGTGKSTDCLIAATLLNLVYITQVYNYETSSSDLLVRVMPKTSESIKLSKEEAKKIGDMLVFAPSEAYRYITGKECENASISDALMAFLERYSISDGSMYYTVDSSIVEAARRPRFLEMQEVPKLRATGILGSLNGLYDKQGGLRLSSGEYVKATNVSCTYITSNGGNYVGNNDLPADFKSRFAWHPISATLSTNDMVKRLFSDKELVELIKKNGYEMKECKDTAKLMAKAVKKLQKEVAINDCYNVSISFREYETWFRRWLVHPDSILEMANETVISAITIDENEMEEYKRCIDTVLA